MGDDYNKVTNLVKSLVVDKFSKVSEPGNQEFTTTKVSSLIQEDSESLYQASWRYVNMSTTPLKIITSGYILLTSLGYSFLCGLILIVVIPIITVQLWKQAEIYWNEHRELKQKKTAEVKELIDNAKIIKLYGWV